MQATANNVNNIASVQYNAARYATMGAETTADYTATDLFVNCNRINTRDVSQTEFEAKITYDSVDDSAGVVYVYLLGETLVAFYDEENLHGYIA